MPSDKPSKINPVWRNDPPSQKSYRSIFKWGSPFIFKHPKPSLLSLIKSRLNLSDSVFYQHLNDGDAEVKLPSKKTFPKKHLNALSKIVGTANVSVDDYSRVRFSSGKTMEEAILLRAQKHPAVSSAAVHPRNKNDIKKIISYCSKNRIPVYTYGGGSSVNLGFLPVKNGITIVMSTHMNRILSINEANQTVTVQPGISGPDLENSLNRAPELYKTKSRFTCGHFPQSFEFSTPGGWISALGSGQKSSYYGDAYDIVISQEYITPAGEIKTLSYPATATGPKINDIMKGSEGCFGILVELTMKIFRHMPENRKNFSFIFPDWQSAVNAAMEISQSENGMPSVLRISDPEESDVAFTLYGIKGTIIDKFISMRGFRPMKRCLLIGQADGTESFTKNVKKQAKKICKLSGGMYISGYPVKKWEHGRYTDPYMREDLHDFGIVIDTLETSVQWDNLHNVHKSVRKFIKTRPDTVCMTHSSHFYPQGTNLYFIFISRFKNYKDYKKFHRGIIQSISDSGGSLSHHHGVGKMIGPWMEKHLGKNQLDVLRSLKKHFDPQNIMNPGGTMGLD